MEVKILEYYWTGHASQYLVPLKRSIAGICRTDRGVANFYIGIASGAYPYDALYRRIDSRKKIWGVSDIWMLYASRSSRSVRWLESELVDHFWGDPRLRNHVAGGGGRIGKGPFHYLYLAHGRSRAGIEGLMDEHDR